MKNRSVAPYILLAAFAVLLTALILVGYTIGNELKLQNQRITSLHEELIRLESLESEIDLMQSMLDEHDYNWEKALTRQKLLRQGRLSTERRRVSFNLAKTPIVPKVNRNNITMR